MKNEENTVEDEATRQGSSSIFSDEDIKNTVREFILAWLRGKIAINFPSARELQNYLLPIFRYDPQAKEKEIKIKEYFINLVSICLGTEKATSKERNKAINLVFRQILALRSGNRIKGTFAEFNIEKRFQILENQVKDTNNLVKELLITVKALLGRNS